ncbi:M48 family metalloprotease [Amycolatopsis vastitatis]|uniref:Zn-dependent protease n=1 Tax=Amycolatopsis vastitatis TaxID=1905142 RepID=A0A229THE3_9PSEU|nr:M48 family metallopeptidase [Amycolatopsis vastitatis]OXM70430.1 Zn-dependent protease [Amycolatopsis vastitatis]
MKTSWRALVAVALLAGFPVLVFLVVGGLAVAEYFFFRHSGILAVKLGIVAVPVSYALLKALFAIERTRGDTGSGVPVTRADEPALWALVEELAAAVGTRPPDTITLVSEVNAGVRERTGWLGLRVRRREMFIGAQLLAGLRHDQLRALLGHELGHYSNNDTRLAGLTYRGRRSIERALTGLGGDGWFEGLVRRLFVLYAKLYFAVSAAACRRQELAADAAAARVAGTAAMTSALREIEALDVAWDFYFDRYVPIGWDAGYLPDRLAGGFRSLLADEARAEEFDRIRQNPPAEETSRYDTHPPTAERIAALEALPEVPVRQDGGHPASEVLRDAATTLEAAMVSDFSDKAKAKRRIGWDRLVDLGVRHSVTRAAAGILGAGGTLAQALDLIDAGRAAELADPEHKPPASAGPRAQREFAAPSVRDRLSTVVKAYLAEAEVAHWKLSWSGPPEFVVDEPYGSELAAALDAASADHDTAPLRRLLVAAGALPVRS